MTQSRDSASSGEGRPEGARSEVLISGVDTGPPEQERANLSPTEDQARFQPAHPAHEPTDEDG
ncbi:MULTISPECIES: hypothetical protein [Deinococcus]|uniref:Uncharacterized protein n=1 Tax=Deinococcus multiflagellatus TaxID=1656887 RepID=A0ABW1ZMC4_9DEIO|nr:MULTISPECIES: hypothetical protein [Deinococcus]MBZ9714058.1 hypothetical protein [Deinococcus multiflagellatus]